MGLKTTPSCDPWNKVLFFVCLLKHLFLLKLKPPSVPHCSTVGRSVGPIRRCEHPLGPRVQAVETCEEKQKQKANNMSPLGDELPEGDYISPEGDLT